MRVRSPLCRVSRRVASPRRRRYSCLLVLPVLLRRSVVCREDDTLPPAGRAADFLAEDRAVEAPTEERADDLPTVERADDFPTDERAVELVAVECVPPADLFAADRLSTVRMTSSRCASVRSWSRRGADERFAPLARFRR